jgi:hypothetical protein
MRAGGLWARAGGGGMRLRCVALRQRAGASESSCHIRADRAANAPSRRPAQRLDGRTRLGRLHLVLEQRRQLGEPAAAATATLGCGVYCGAWAACHDAGRNEPAKGFGVYRGAWAESADGCRVRQRR